MMVSFFINKVQTTNSQVPLLDQLNFIKNGKYQSSISQCRLALKSGNKSLYQNLKNQLPAVTFCGTFLNQRKADLISSYNQLLIVDVDHIDESIIPHYKEDIISEPSTIACFLSPSGEGLKFLVKLSTSVEFHKKAFKELSEYYHNKYNIQIDKSGSDCSRLCYVSYDPEIYINLNARPFEFDFTPELPQEVVNDKIESVTLVKRVFNVGLTNGYNKSYDRKIMGQIIKFLTKNNKSITETHEKWYKCAYAIANTFTSDIGVKYFIALSELDKEKYDEKESYGIIEYCYSNRRSDGLGFNTIIFFAQEQGFVIKHKVK